MSSTAYPMHTLQEKSNTSGAFQPPEPLYPQHNNLRSLPTPGKYRKPQKSRTEIFQLGTLNPQGINESFSFN